jgi:hypothetical protein
MASLVWQSTVSINSFFKTLIRHSKRSLFKPLNKRRKLKLCKYEHTVFSLSIKILVNRVVLDFPEYGS